MAAIPFAGAQSSLAQAQRRARVPESHLGREGKPRQRHVAFLGSLEIDAITEAKSPLGSWYDDVMTTVRRRFWYDVTTLLERLSNRVDPQDRQRIADSIAKKVGGRLMTEAELKQFDREIEAMFELPPRAGYK